MWQPGDSVLLRGVLDGSVRWAFPHTVVEDTAERVVLFIRPGIEGRLIPRDEADYLERFEAGVDPEPHVWAQNRVLRLMRFGESHSLDLFWDDASGDFLGWYVNLQTPLQRSALGFDCLDHALDVWIEPDGAWQWKDEDDLERCVELGIFSPAEAAEIRAEGERVVSALPELLPTGWEDWRPDPAWPAPTLPPRWDVP